MPEIPMVKVIETKRKPPMWAVKVGARYKASYMGDGARERAITYAATLGSNYGLVERPAPKREQARRGIPSDKE
jgi:hypothetical protein